MKQILVVFGVVLSFNGFSQSMPNGSYNFNGDPAAAYNKYLVTKNERAYTQVGVYKVLGTYYLFGENHLGHMYASNLQAQNIKLSYNTYNQELAFLSSSNPDKPLVKEAGTLDSFILKSDSLIMKDMLFVYGKLLGTSDPSYYQRITGDDKNLVLYKKYRSVIAPTTSIAETDLKQFDLETSYYYYDKSKKEMKKLKMSYNAIKKELAAIPDLDKILDRNLLVNNPEAALVAVFRAAN